MRPQDFIKLIKYVSDKQQQIFNADKLISCNIFMKNDPKECFIHISDENKKLDFTFFEYDDYYNSKYEIDEIFKMLNKN